jgi:UDP-GlcNAc:undecaprenyl-phosphate GlcNAc-1-phosphate transferase
MLSMISEITSNFILMSLLSVLYSFVLVYYLVPKITGVIVRRKLNDEPDHRSSHTAATPTMGGVSFFIVLVLTVFFTQQFDQEHVGVSLIASTTLIFISGLKDDLVGISPRAKLFIQFCATLFLFYQSGWQEPTLHGLFGVHEIPVALYYSLLMILVLTIVNAYNLIDGVDGLAATIGMVVFSIFSVIFYAAGMSFYFLLCLSFVGMLLAYIYYNFSSTKKIFMGDTGSLLIGFCIAFMALKFLSISPAMAHHFRFEIENKIFVLTAILCIPLIDTFRVIGVRLWAKKSPFFPDRNHMHHVLIDKGLSHLKTTLVLGFVNFKVVILTLWCASIFNSVTMLLLTIIVFAVFLVVVAFLKKTIANRS